MAKKITIFPGKNMIMEDVPEDVQKIILEKKNAEEADCDCMRSQQYAIFKMIREWANFGRDGKNKKTKE